MVMRSARQAWAILLLLLMLCRPIADAKAQTPCVPLGTNQDCTNSGPISGGGVGIEDTATLTLLNTSSGNVSGFGRGILASTSNITNFGTIESSGGFGIDSNIINLTNSGLVSGSSGIVGNFVSVVNSGTITGLSNGIVATDIAVMNSGTISGAGSTGIFGFNNFTVTNTGTITGSDGIVAGAGANVTNSGLLIGTGGTALWLNLFSGPVADVVTLMPGSRIVGGIILGGGGDTVNFRGGNNNLTFDTLAGATVTSTAPAVIIGNQVITVDPRSFAESDLNLLDFTRSVSSAVPVFNDDTVACARSPNAPEEAQQSSAGGSFVRYCDGRTVWATAFGGRRDQSAGGGQAGASDRYFGSMLGGDWRALTNLRLGAFAGAGAIRAADDLGLSKDESDIFFGGLYGRYNLGPSFLSSTLQVGHASMDTVRFVNNNLAAGGLESAEADYDAWYFSPEADLGASLVLGDGNGVHYVLTPSVKLRYLYASLDGYTESGTTAPLTIGGREVNDFEERAQLKLTGTQANGPMGTVTASIYGGVIGIQRQGDSTIDATLLGQAIPFAVPGQGDLWGGYGGGDVEFRSGDVALFLSGEYFRFSDDSTILDGQAGLRIGF